MSPTHPVSQDKETIDFQVHPAIIEHFIHSQAGTIGKAIIELVQNAVDAGASRCDITIDREGFVVADDGKGFASHAEIHDWFRTFGTPHEEGDATFGRFRVGRGQIMGFAKTQWTSQQFVMDVDIKNRGMRFELEMATTAYLGCHIRGTWYSPLDKIIPADGDMGVEEDPLEDLLEELRRALCYLSITLTLNGDSMGKDPSKEIWDMETEEAYFRFKASGSMSIYNQGIFVRNDTGQQWGCGGTVVTKKAIKLNVSRSEILRKDCPVWANITQVIRKHAAQLRRKTPSTRSDENSRAFAARQLLTGVGRLLDDKVITLVPKQHVSLDQFRKMLHKPYVVAKPEEMVLAEKIAKLGEYLVVHPDTLSRFWWGPVEDFGQKITQVWIKNIRSIPHYPYLSIEEYEIYLQDAIRYGQESFAREASFEVAARDLTDEKYTLLQIPELPTPEDQRVFRAIRRPLTDFIRLMLQYSVLREEFAERPEIPSLHPGTSLYSEAWTDGRRFVAIDQKVIHAVQKDGVAGFLRIIDLLVHEMCHGPDVDSMDAPHDEIFYERFHRLILDPAVISEREFTLRKCVAEYLRVCKKDKVNAKNWAAQWDPRRAKKVEVSE